MFLQSRYVTQPNHSLLSWCPQMYFKCRYSGRYGMGIPLVRRQLNCLRLWNRLLNMDENRLTKHIFQWDYMKCRNNWCHDIKTLLKSVDCGNMYLSASTDKQNVIISIEFAKDKLTSNYKAKWWNDISSQNKLDIYRINADLEKRSM